MTQMPPLNLEEPLGLGNLSTLSEQDSDIFVDAAPVPGA